MANQPTANRPGVPLPNSGSVWAIRLPFLLAVLLSGAAIALAAGRVPSIVLGVGWGAFWLVAGYLLHRWSRPMAAPQPDEHFVDVMPCYLSVQDRSLRILEVNELFRRDFGHGIGQLCYTVYKRRDTPCPDCPVLKTFADGEDHVREETVQTQAGKEYKVVVTSTPLLNGRGEVRAVMEMSTNVTEVQTLREELKRSQQYFQSLFDIVPCYITIQNRNYEIIETNALFRRDFAQVERNHCYAAYKRRTEVCPNCPVEKTLADGQIHSSEETVITKDGREAEMVVYSMPIQNEQGEITAVMEVSTNITQVKQLQRQLAMVGLAVAGMAHRIKNVLMGLEGGIFVVNTGLQDDDSATLQTGWEMVQRNVGKVSRIAKDLLFCSKERVPDFQPDVSPKKIAREVVELYRPRAEQDNVAITLEVDDRDDRGFFDPEAIQSLLTNLTTNALDACRFDPSVPKKQHRITIRCALDDAGAVMLEVTDNGAGIPQEDTGRVFQSFFSSKGTEGTGLGLFVSQKVVEEHGGTINFETAEGQGTTFRMVLPRRPPELSSKATPPA